METGPSRALVRAGLALIAVLLAGVLRIITSGAIPMACTLALLALALATARAERAPDPQAAVIEPLAWAPSVLVVSAFAYVEVRESLLNPPDGLEFLVYLVLAGAAAVVCGLLVGGAGVIADAIGRHVGADRVRAPLAIVAVTCLVSALALGGAAVSGAVRHPTARGWVARLPVAAELAALTREPPRVPAPAWSEILEERRANACGHRVRHIRFSESCLLRVAPEGAPLEGVYPDVRGEPGDFVGVLDVCGRTTIRCDATSLTPAPVVVAEVADHRLFFWKDDAWPMTFLPPDVVDTCTAPHVWWVASLFGLAAAIALGWASASRAAGSHAAARLALAALAVFLTSSPVAVGLARGAIHP